MMFNIWYLLKIVFSALKQEPPKTDCKDIGSGSIQGGRHETPQSCNDRYWDDGS